MLHCHSVFLISNIGQVLEKGEVEAVDTWPDRSSKQTWLTTETDGKKIELNQLQYRILHFGSKQYNTAWLQAWE